MTIDPTDSFMDLAIEQANLALAAGDYPIGAVLVVDGQRFCARNTRNTGKDKKAHAEINTLKMAQDFAASKEKTLYVTLQPCTMCAKALMDFGIRQVYFLLEDPINGGCMPGVSVIQLDRPEYRRQMVDWLRNNKGLYPAYYSYFTSPTFTEG